MENEKKLPTAAQELTDEEMDKVVGGANDRKVLVKTEYSFGYVYKTYKTYEWKGTDDYQKYLCPNCHRPVHPGGWGRYFCDPCDESWFVERLMEMNPNGGWVCTGEYVVEIDPARDARIR